MQLSDLVDELKFVMNINDGQVDADFSEARLKKMLSFAYKQEVSRGKQEGDKTWFMYQETATWPSGQRTFTLPETVASKNILTIQNTTISTPGTRLDVSTQHLATGIYWENSNTLAWNTDGPPSDQTLVFYYFADAEDLAQKSDDWVPRLVAPEHHFLLVWSAAILAREIADEEAPSSWYAKRNELRMDYLKFISRPRIFDNENWIGLRDSDLLEGVWF